MEIRIVGVGTISLEELEARFAAYLNAGAPEPVLEGALHEKRGVLERIAERGDRQMKALVARYLNPDHAEDPDAR